MVRKIFVAAAFLGLLWLLLVSPRANQETQVLGGQERVRLIIPDKEVEIIAKIDTGADFSSIDEKLADSLGLKASRRRIIVITAEGRQEREAVSLVFMLGERKIDTVATVADRSRLSTPMLVGTRDLEGFLIDASRQFLTRPSGTPGFPLPFLPDGFSSAGIEKFIIIIPMLGTLVVLLRLLAGIRTYGVFAPVVIALSLTHLGVVPGMMVYLFLIAGGILAQVFILARFRLPHIAQFALIMFTLVLALTGISASPIGFAFSVTGAFFPLIISSHLIEQASLTIEEHRFSDSLPVLVYTLAVAMLLGFYGSFLVGLPLSTLWIIFGFSILVTIVAGHYLGLRLTEFIRFKFLKRTHVHR
ncbi:MAG: aspartyl protease family protein [Chloroflexi bacterium]|nr:aspartyl protease family protein [Chloroflexota bacterium]